MFFIQAAVERLLYRKSSRILGGFAKVFHDFFCEKLFVEHQKSKKLLINCSTRYNWMAVYTNWL